MKGTEHKHLDSLTAHPKGKGMVTHVQPGFPPAAQIRARFKTYELLISGTFLPLFLGHESETTIREIQSASPVAGSQTQNTCVWSNISGVWCPVVGE